MGCLYKQVDRAVSCVMNNAERFGEPGVVTVITGMALHDDSPAFIHVFFSGSRRAAKSAEGMLPKNSDFRGPAVSSDVMKLHPAFDSVARLRPNHTLDYLQ